MEKEAEAKTGFTAGPWTVQKLDDNLAICAPDGWHVAVVMGWADNENDRREFELSANLIASAPDLYEAVRRWLTWCDDWHAGKPHPVDDLKFARAALARARGENP